MRFRWNEGSRIKTEKTRVAVLYGGRSGEHEVSLRSAASVIPISTATASR